MDTLTHPSGPGDGSDQHQPAGTVLRGLRRSEDRQRGRFQVLPELYGGEKRHAADRDCAGRVRASQTRFNEARAMLDYGFNGYKRVTVLQKGDRLGQKVKVHLGMQDEVDAAAGSGLSMLIKLGQEKQLSLEVELPEEVEAPLKAGTRWVCSG